MKRNKIKINPVFQIFLIFLALILLSLTIAVGLLFYVFYIPEPKGLSPAAWPETFTNQFGGAWILNENGTIKIEDKGREYLEEYGLWLQVIDENGKDIFSYHKPDGIPESYSASELIAFSSNPYYKGETIFLSSFEDGRQTLNYLIGFPYIIGKKVIYYNGETVKPFHYNFPTMLRFIVYAIILVFLGCSFWITRHLGKITKGIEDIAHRCYQPFSEKSIFSGVYATMNEMDLEIRHSDQMKKHTERTRREWITNISHDLKTPLSPIKGYAELLSGTSAIDKETVREYGNIILKNANYTESLINDLKLTYQLDSGAIPYNPKAVQFARYLREVVINIVNDPAFSNRNIEFESAAEEIVANIDADLFRRAIENIIINALTHNPAETSVLICLERSRENEASIIVRDNGAGISDTEQAEVFERYYRGTSTKEKPEGSGLGLAIAKQIISLHGGIIAVKSKVNKGTEFIVSIPINQ